VLEEVSLLLNEPDEETPAIEQNDPALLASFDAGRYALVDYLGKGGVSEVYSAEDHQLGRIVAIKFFLPGTIGGNSADEVVREARMLSNLNHPNIVTIYEVIQSPSGLAIVMELIEGIPLRSLCKSPLPEARIIRLSLQIAQALGVAHSCGIVHRDIKPENILVRPDGYVKVVDFSLAHRFSVDSSPTYDPTAGTLRYMSPEQVLGKPLSPASDIFSLGLVLYELATGEHPFPGTSSVEMAYSIATKPVARFSRRSSKQPSLSRLEKLITAMLAKDPAARPTATNVADELEAILRLSKSMAPSRTSHRKFRLWFAGLAACLVAVASIGWLEHSKRPAPIFADFKIRPLTSQAGWENAPALSPDGRSIAFTWADKLDGVRNLYIKRLSDDSAVKLTNNSHGLIGYPAWSPDGKRLAFKYADNQSARRGGSLFLISVQDAKQEKVFDLKDANLSSSIDWSPDGTELAFSDVVPGTGRLAIYLLTLGTGKTRRLTSPPPEDWGDWNPKFSPDGSTIAFKRVGGFWFDDMYLVPASGGVPRRLTAMRLGIWGHAWLPDGKSLIVSCQRAGSIFGIWRLPTTPDESPERISVSAIDAITPTASRRTDTIAWVNQLWDLNIYRTATDGTGSPARFIASTLRDQGAAYSPDGRIAFVSDRSGSREIWLAHADGSGQVRVTNLQGSPIDQLVWSPDGQQLAFYGRVSDHSGTFVLHCSPGGMSCGKPEPLIPDGAPESAAAWSADGKSVYFASERTGRREIWKQPVSGGAPLQVTHEGGYVARESPGREVALFLQTGERGNLSDASFGHLPCGASSRRAFPSPVWRMGAHSI
jgi:serine/threonine protein kinase